MTVMPNFTQFVSLVAKGGTPITIADAFGNPYPTTGHGALVFNEGAVLHDVTYEGILNADALHVGPGSPSFPSISVGDMDTGLYAPAPGILGVTANGVPSASFNENGIAVTGDISYTGVLHGAYHSPLTTQGDLYYFGATGVTRLPLGGAGNVLASNGTGLVYAPPAAGGTITAVNQVNGETVATPNPIITTGTIGLASTAVTPGTYGDGTHVPSIQVDQKGRITSASNIPVTVGGTVTSVAAGTGLAATPSPIIAAGTIRLADTAVTPATYGSATNIPQLVVDQQGRITSASNVAVSIPPAGVTSLTAGTGITMTPASPITSTGTIAVNTTVIATKTDLNNYLLLTGGTVTGTVIFQPPAPLTVNTPAFTINQTWNNAAVSFTGISENITDTASQGGSRLISLQVGSNDRFYVDKFGTSVVNGNTYAGGSAHTNTGTGIPPGGTLDSGYMFSSVANFGLTFGSGVPNKAFAKGTIYAPSDGNGLPYSNIDGTATGWVRQAAIAVSDTAPVKATPDMLWWNSVLGQMFIRYDDSTSVQWVAAAPSSAVQTVLQTVSTETGALATGTTTIPADDTIPQITEGTEFMTLAITPRSATSRLVIEVIANISNSAANNAIIALFQDSTANALAVANQYQSTSTAPVQLSIRHTMTSGTTSATTFRVRGGGSSVGTATFNGSGGARSFGGAFASSIVIQEVA